MVLTNELIFLNKYEKCSGRITRSNSNNPSDTSAIDIVISTPQIEKNLSSMLIDEDGLFKIKGKKETDHNTIIVTFLTTSDMKQPTTKNSVWRLQAPECNWTEFNKGLFKLTNELA